MTPAAMKPRISIITIVKNERGIEDTLTALAKQDRPAPTEVIVVDAADPSRLADIRARHPETRWYGFSPPTAGKTTIPEQRNFGIRQANGDIIVFIDANCIPSERWLTSLTRPLISGEETVVSGSVHALKPKTQINYNPSPTGKYLKHAGSANLAFLKGLMSAIGGFDESFLYSSDTDFTWRCIAAGHRILYVPEATVTHDWGDWNNEMRRSFNYGKGRARLYFKHPHRIPELLNDTFYVSAYTIYIIGLPLTFYFWWYPFLILVPLVKNISKKPIKVVVSNLSYTLGMWKGIFMLFFAGELS